MIFLLVKEISLETFRNVTSFSSMPYCTARLPFHSKRWLTSNPAIKISILALRASKFSTFISLVARLTPNFKLSPFHFKNRLGTGSLVNWLHCHHSVIKNTCDFRRIRHESAFWISPCNRAYLKAACLSMDLKRGYQHDNLMKLTELCTI